MNLGLAIRRLFRKLTPQDLAELTENRFQELQMNSVQREILSKDKSVDEVVEKMTSGKVADFEKAKSLYDKLPDQKKAAAGEKIARTFKEQEKNKKRSNEGSSGGGESKF